MSHDVKTVPVILYGSLRRRFGRRFDLAVSSPAHAIRHMCGALPGFKQYLQQYSWPGYHILVGGEAQSLETLDHPAGPQAIRIIPAVAGAGGKGFGTTILGLALVVASYFIPGTQGWLTKIGLAMAFTGVSRMMAPSPPRNNRKEADDPGHSFNGTDNVIAQGQPVPVLYGRARVGSLVVSIGTSAESNFPTGPDGGPFSGNGGTWSQMSSKGGISAWFNNGDGSATPFVWNVDPV